MDYEEFKKILKENNLTIKEFSKLAGVSYRTCNNWAKAKRSVSDWVESWLKLYIENQEYKKYKEVMQTLVTGLNTENKG